MSEDVTRRSGRRYEAVRKIDVVSSVFSCKRSKSDSRVEYIEDSGKNVSRFNSSGSKEDGSDDLNGAAENVQAVGVTFGDSGHTIGMGDQSRILHFSLASQIDGLVYALLGIRLERDALASTQATSLCQFYGCEEFVPWSAYSMLYVPRFDNATINSMLTRAAAQKVIGVFVLPVDGTDLVPAATPPKNVYATITVQTAS